MDKPGYVYIMASDEYGTLYTGVTSNLIRRVWEHRESGVDGFTKKYGVKRLVWYEVHADIAGAIQREKQINGIPAFAGMTRRRWLRWVCVRVERTHILVLYSARAISSFWMSLVPS